MLKTKSILINKQNYVIKQSFKSLLLFEEMTNKNVAKIDESLTDTLKLFYCMLKASNEDFTYNFNQFIDVIDENENALTSFNKFIIELSDTDTTDKKKNKG